MTTMASDSVAVSSRRIIMIRAKCGSATMIGETSVNRNQPIPILL